MYFENCNTKEEMKKEYKRLSKKLHPDVNNGDDKEFKEMLNEYQNKQSFDFSNMEEDFKIAFMAVSVLDGIDIEVIGTWIWLSGDTKPIKEALKEAGFKWASKKKMWYFGTTTKSRGKQTIDQIRKTYGSQTIKTSKTKRIA